MPAPLALVVEDDAGSSELFGSALAAAGFVVETVRHGNTAFARLGEVTPAVVVLDLRLPGMPGEVLLDEIRTQPRLAHTHVIVLSGDAQRAELGGEKADLVLVKPVGYAQLYDLAKRLVKGRQE
jgi:CheY-like chemotaxis protein